jgi:hypothetical protein
MKEDNANRFLLLWGSIISLVLFFYFDWWLYKMLLLLTCGMLIVIFSWIDKDND